jgi:hypothetical protein
MEFSGGFCPVQKVAGSPDIMEDIVQRVGSTVSMIRCRAVCSTWAAASRTPSFARSFAERTKRANVGFIVQFHHGVGRLTKLLYTQPSQGDETADVMRSRVDLSLLQGDNVLGSRDGVLLTLGAEGGSSPEGYNTSCPWDSPRVYTRQATLLPRIPRDPEQHTVNTFGQFAVLPAAGRAGMSFFVKEPAQTFICTYAGVSFCSGANIFVHVSVLTDGQWVRHVSNPIPSPEAALFHSYPYSIQDGETLYMMYLVGYIMCFDMASKTFSEIALPSNLGETAVSWYDYTVADRNAGGLVLVHYTQGMLQRWVLRLTTNGAIWTLASQVDLVHAFGSRISPCCWRSAFSREAFPIGSDNFYSVQVRKASTDGSLVFLTLGFADGMFEVDMDKEFVTEITNEERDGAIGSIFHLAEPWPPAGSESI